MAVEEPCQTGRVVDGVEWGLVVPVKRLAAAKSRLAVLGEELRVQLALAFAVDVVSAAVACDRVGLVLVVTDDPVAGAALAAAGARVVADAPDAGHNPALSYGAALLPGTFGAVALSADLPALTAEVLSAALAGVPDGGRAFVPDAAGEGTTLLAAAPGIALLPAYGQSSRQDHLRSGAVELVADARLRCDVDTPEDLTDAIGLGVGSATTDVLRRHATA